MEKEMTFLKFLTNGILNKIYLISGVAIMLFGIIMAVDNNDTMYYVITAVGTIFNIINILGSYLSWRKKP